MLENIVLEALSKLDSCNNQNELNEVKAQYLGKKGSISSISCSVVGGGDVATVGNIALYDYQGNLVASGSGASSLPVYITNLNTFLDSNGKFSYPCYVECDITCADYSSHATSTNYYTFTFNNTLSGSFDLKMASASEVASSSVVVNDSEGNEHLSDIQEKTEDTNETTHSIFDSISDFFGSFFDNLIGVFVPEDGFFTTWFNNLNDVVPTWYKGIINY